MQKSQFEGKFLPNTALIILYAGITLFMVFHHEPWRDEAQSWLIVRDLDLPGIFRQMSYEGTPALWHMLLYPFVRLGFPFFTQQLLNWTLAVAFMSVFVIYSPFPFITKASFAFSMFIGYEYPVISRSYSMSILILFAIAALYRKRFDRPLVYGILLFLLFNSIVFNLAGAAFLLFMFGFEFLKRKSQLTPKAALKGYYAILIATLGGGLSFIQLLPREDNFFGGNLAFYRSPADIFTAILPNAVFTSLLPGYAYNIVFFSIAVLVFIAVLFSLKYWPILLNFLLTFAWFTYIFAFRYPAQQRHFGLFLIYLVFCLWLALSSNEMNLPKKYLREIAVYGLTTCLAFSIFPAFERYSREYRKDFSTSGKMASFITANHLEGKIFAAHRSPLAESILPYLPKGKKFWYPDIEDYGSFITWNKKQMANSFMPDNVAIDRTFARFPDRRNLLLLLTSPLGPSESSYFELLYYTSGALSDEVYYLYRPLF